MVDGACGLSTGLIYAPGSYAETIEIVEIAKGAGAAGGFYASHIRGEGATLLDAVAEAIGVGREGRLPVQVSHIKAARRSRPDRRRARRRPRRHGRRLPVHGLEHDDPDAPAGLGARRWHRSHAGPAPRSRHARAHPGGHGPGTRPGPG